MGGSSSKEEEVSSEQQELESLATSTGSLLILQKAFSKLADPHTNSIPLKTLQECFSLNMKDSTSEATLPTDYFPKLLLHLGPSLVDLFFIADKGGIDWIQFLRGYIKCCGRMPLSSSISILYRLYAGTSSKAGYPLKVEFESDDADCKVKGTFTAADILMILWICWIMSQCSNRSNYSQGKVKINVPDINNLLLSAIASCTEDVKDLNVWEYSISGVEVQLQAQKVHMWVLSTVPNLAHCFTDYVVARLQRCANLEGNLESSNVLTSDIFFAESPYKHLLTCGTAWAISLTQGSIASREILDASTSELDDGTFENLLYRSSLHGRGLNRFWSNIEGYHGPLLTLVSANPGNADESNRWVIGVLLTLVSAKPGSIVPDQAQGIDYLHCCNPPIFHRDLKSSNLLVKKSWTVKVGDFGLACPKPKIDFTESFGMPGWMSPEALCRHPYDEKTDVYSYGVVLWELVTKKIPWEGLSRDQYTPTRSYWWPPSSSSNSMGGYPPYERRFSRKYGDLLQLITNDKFKSVDHRVLARPIGPRISVAVFFFQRDYETKLFGPIPELFSEDDPPVYRETSVSEYTKFYNSKGLDGKSALPHFKI